jgi:hypothetical protein
MAITSLFGPTPQELIAAQVREQEQMDMLRNQQIAQQGREFGVFAPLYQAGLKFGDLGSRAITRSLFPEVQNPQLQQAQTIQSVIQSYQGQNLGDPTVLQKIASDLFAAGDPDAGIKALATARSLAPKNEFVTGKPGEKIFKRGPGGQLTEVVNIPDREKDLKPSTNFGEVAVELGFGAKSNLDEYTPAQAKAINAEIQRRKESEKKAGVTPPVKQFGADIGLREAFLKEVKPIDEPLNALDKAQSLLNEQSGLADSIAKRQFAKFAGDRDISNKDVAAFGNFGPLGQRLGGIFSQFLQGTYSDAQREEAITIIKNLRNPLEQQRVAIEQQFTGAASRQGITGDQASFVVPGRAKGIRQMTAPSETVTPNAITLPSGNRARPL